MMFTPFITPAALYDQNMFGSTKTYARQVLISGPDGRTPGIGLFREKYLIGILTEDDATRLADQIIDAVEAS